MGGTERVNCVCVNTQKVEGKRGQQEAAGLPPRLPHSPSQLQSKPPEPAAPALQFSST